jgi:hypothetical protein
MINKLIMRILDSIIIIIRKKNEMKLKMKKVMGILKDCNMKIDTL